MGEKETERERERNRLRERERNRKKSVEMCVTEKVDDRRRELEKH